MRRAIGFNRTATVLRTGGVAAMSFATGNMGVATTMLQRQRAAAAATLYTRGAGDLDLTLVLADASTRGRADPAFAAHSEPINQWALAVWCRWMTSSELARLHEHAQHQCRDADRMWSRVAGPAAAAAASAKRIGWKMPSADCFITDEGRTLNLTLDAPADVEVAVQHYVRR